MAKIQTKTYPYTLTDPTDRGEVSAIQTSSDPLLESIRSLVNKQNKLIGYERVQKERAVRELQSENELLREQIRTLNGGAGDGTFLSCVVVKCSA